MRVGHHSQRSENFAKTISSTPDENNYFMEFNSCSYMNNQPFRTNLFTFKNVITFQKFIAEFCMFRFKNVNLNDLDKELLTVKSLPIE